jgi:hypothetical protein
VRVRVRVRVWGRVRVRVWGRRRGRRRGRARLAAAPPSASDH